MMLAIALVLLHLVSRCRGGVTSSYRRKLEASVDMPLNSDVFRRPPGYNAPEQVGFFSISKISIYNCKEDHIMILKTCSVNHLKYDTLWLL